MSKCIVCGNSSPKTKHTRPGLHYHKFPRNAHYRRKWLEILGIDHYLDWNCICGDHFLQENYSVRRPHHLLRNAIPQPYNQKGNDDRFLNKKKHFEKYTAINNFESQRHSFEKIKLATIYDGNGYQKIPKIQIEQLKSPVDNIQPVNKTFEVPVRSTTANKDNKDYTLGNGLRCSVKSCSNRKSKDLSFFGYPNDLILRKMWVEKTGLKEDFIENIKRSARVCAVHFNDFCFTNPRKNRLVLDAIPSLFLDNDFIETNNIPSISTVNSESNHANKSSCSSSNYVANKDPEETSVLVSIDSTTRYAKDFDPDCRVPGCITNDIIFEDVALFVPTIKCVNEWSSSLGLQLTVNSIVCERHFRPQDLLSSESLVNGVSETIKLLAPHALPVRSAYHPVPLKTNVVPLLKTHKRQFKSAKDHKADKQLSTNKINDVLDNTDKCSTTNIFTSIDDFPCIEPNLQQKPKNISANSPLFIIFEPIENSQVIEPSVNSFSKPTSSSSMSITLQPKPKHNLTSTINNNVPLVNLTHSFPSTSNSSVNNLSQQCLLEHEQQEATSSFKTQGTLSSNSIIHPKVSGNQIKCSKPISPAKKIKAKLPKKRTPVISKVISLNKKSNTHYSNSYTSINTTQRIIINDGSTENVEQNDYGFIFEMSKVVQLPSSFWKTKHIRALNVTCFYQEDIFEKPVKEIHFYNDLVPIVKIYGKNYNCNTQFKSKDQFQNFLFMINNIEKCSGLFGIFKEKCIGYVEDSSKNIQMCSACQQLLLMEEDFHTIKSKIIKNVEYKLTVMRARLLKQKN